MRQGNFAISWTLSLWNSPDSMDQASPGGLVEGSGFKPWIEAVIVDSSRSFGANKIVAFCSIFIHFAFCFLFFFLYPCAK
jgi:hypothetical protein